MRRFITFLLVTLGTAAGGLWWLVDGDLTEVVDPELVDWDAELLALDAGVVPEVVVPGPGPAPAPVDE